MSGTVKGAFSGAFGEPAEMLFRQVAAASLQSEMNTVNEAASAKVWGKYTGMTKECRIYTERKHCVAFPLGLCKGGICYALAAMLLNADFGKRRLAHTRDA